LARPPACRSAWSWPRSPPRGAARPSIPTGWYDGRLAITGDPTAPQAAELLSRRDEYRVIARFSRRRPAASDTGPARVVASGAGRLRRRAPSGLSAGDVRRLPAAAPHLPAGAGRSAAALHLVASIPGEGRPVPRRRAAPAWFAAPGWPQRVRASPCGRFDRSPCVRPRRGSSLRALPDGRQRAHRGATAARAGRVAVQSVGYGWRYRASRVAQRCAIVPTGSRRGRGGARGATARRCRTPPTGSSSGSSSPRPAPASEHPCMGRVERVPQQRPRRVMSSNCRYISRLGPV
jgi:hypothetical protein